MSTFVLYSNSFELAPQTSQVLKHLINVGDISGVEAAAMYKVRSLSKRMSEINDALYFNGLTTSEFAVEGQWSTDNTGQRYKRYVLPLDVRNALHSVEPAGTPR